MIKSIIRLAITIGFIVFPHSILAEEPLAINPFGKNTSERDDAVLGYIVLSDGSVHPGKIFLTRDKRLKISDEELQRQREIPLSAVKQIDCTVKKEWMEKEWKFKESAKDEKIFTGRSYPAREYIHAVTLTDGRTIKGGLSEIVYVQALASEVDKPSSKQSTNPERFILNKRNKGEVGQSLQSLVYVKSIKLGEKAFEEGKSKASSKKR